MLHWVRGLSSARAWQPALAGACVLALVGCASPTIDHYREMTPSLDLRHYFSGKLVGHGMVQDRQGTVLRRFRVDIDAEWDGDAGTFDEQFLWADGSEERRVWTVIDRGVRDGVRRYVGKAHDVIGVATGEAAGNTLRWRYTMSIPVDGEVYAVDFDDWMHLIDERLMIGRARMSKWGFDVGEVTLTFTRNKERS
jgi:hypothetical protein